MVVANVSDGSIFFILARQLKSQIYAIARRLPFVVIQSALHCGVSGITRIQDNSLTCLSMCFFVTSGKYVRRQTKLGETASNSFTTVSIWSFAE